MSTAVGLARTAQDRFSTHLRADAARAWSRRGAASGSLALIDPDVEGTSPLLARLRAVGIRVDVHQDELSALVHLGAQSPDVVVVSCELATPDLGRLITVIRDELAAPVLLSVRDGQTSMIGPAVAAGARPVVSRPYRFEELLSSLEPHWPRQTRRSRLEIGELVLDLDGYDARLGRAPVDFTGTEFEVVTVLARSIDHVVRRQAIARCFWPTSADPDGALVATIARIRRKLDGAGAPRAVHTVRGIGYRLESAALRLTTPPPPRAGT